MATISEISQGSSYRGDPALGGGLGVGITIDSSPLQRFATFIYYRDQNLWNQKLKDDATAAKQIADMSAYDITSPLKPYSDDLKTELSDLQKFVRENPDALLYSRNPKKYQELQERLGRFENKRAKATTNDALYNSAKSKAEQIVDPEERELELRKVEAKVDRLFSGGLETAYNQQFESIPALKPSDYKIPSATLTKRSIILPGATKDIITEVSYTDLDDLYAKAAITAASQKDEDIRKYDWFKKLSPNEQQIALDESKITSKERKMLQGISVEFTSALKAWKSANQGVDINSISDISVLPDGTLENNIRSIKAINDGIDQLNGLVLAGKVADPSGRVRTIPYKKINFEDGLSEEELIVVKSLQESKTPLISIIDKTIQEHDDAIQREQLAISRGHLSVAQAQERRLGETQTGGDGNTQTTGNAFDEIGGVEPLMSKTNSTKISNGIVYGKDGKPMTGKVSVDVTLLPTNMVSALQTAKTEIPNTGYVDVIAKDGVIMSVTDKKKRTISRQAMENAQKKFDTEQKGQIRTQWGRVITQEERNEENRGKAKFPLPKGKAFQIEQDGFVYTWDENTGTYK